MSEEQRAKSAIRRQRMARKGAGSASKAPVDRAASVDKTSRASVSKAASANKSGKASSMTDSIKKRERASQQPVFSAADNKTRMRVFLESTVLDFLLVLMVSVALTFTVSYGFDSAPLLRGNVALLCLMQAPLLAALFWGTWSRRVLPYSIGASIAIAALVVGLSMAVSPAPLFADGVYNDVTGNYATLALVSVVCSTLCYLLSRRRLGLVVLLVAGIIACGAVQFLWREWMVEQPGLAATGVFLAGAAMLFVFQTYKQSVYSAKRVKRTSFFGAFGFSALVGVVCVLAGLGVFYGIINGLGMQTPEIKPFEETVARPIDNQNGVYDDIDDNSDQTSDELGEESPTREDSPDGSGTGVGSGMSRLAEGLASSPVGQAVQFAMGYSSSDPDQQYEEIDYLIAKITAIVIGVLLVLLLLAAVLLQRKRRTYRLQRMEKKNFSYARRVWELYTFLMGRLRRLKLGKPAHLTPLEYAASFETTLAAFSRGTGGITFLDVTKIYMDACWGGCEVSQQEFAQVEAFYLAFFKNARERVGWPKWLLWKFWRI